MQYRISTLLLLTSVTALLCATYNSESTVLMLIVIVGSIAVLSVYTFQTVLGRVRCFLFSLVFVWCCWLGLMLTLSSKVNFAEDALWIVLVEKITTPDTVGTTLVSERYVLSLVQNLIAATIAGGVAQLTYTKINSKPK